MKRQKLIATAAVVVISASVLTAGASAWAKQRGHDRSERMVGHITDVLSLDEGQVAALNSLVDEVQETRNLMVPDRTGLMNNLTSLVTAETFDQQRALTMMDERITALQSNTPELVNAAAVFFDGLSAEQKAELSEKVDKMHQRHERRHR